LTIVSDNTNDLDAEVAVLTLNIIFVFKEVINGRHFPLPACPRRINYSILRVVLAGTIWLPKEQ